MIVGETAIGIGLLLGTLLLKMFLSAMSLILKVDSPIEFALAPQAILITFVGYTILFVVVGLINIRSLKKGQVVELSRASQKPKRPPVFSWVLGLFAVLCLSIGYYLAWTADGRTVLFRMLPVIGIVCVGTYFLFSQLSVAFLRTIKERKGLYFKGVNLLTISELRFKIQDNARVLSITAILTAVVITAVGTLDIGSQTLLEMREFEFPQALSVTIRGRLQPPELEKLDVSIRNEFQSRGLDVQSGMVLPGIMFRGPHGELDILFL
jgi:putative ABC transport system permease protein